MNTSTSTRVICRPPSSPSPFPPRSFSPSSLSSRNPTSTTCPRARTPQYPSLSTHFLDSTEFVAFRSAPRRTLARASGWASEASPYETLELERDADEEKIKIAYRRLAKYYHPDVYDGRGSLEEGETAENRFIKIQAAYELLMDEEKRRDYDKEHRINPMKASKAWTDWLMKKRKAFDQRGDMAIAAWAEQQHRELILRARFRSRSKIDPEEERILLAKERKASMENFSNTRKRHTLILKKRDLMRKKAEEDQKRTIIQLLAAEGLELDTDGDEDEDDN